MTYQIVPSVNGEDGYNNPSHMQDVEASATPSFEFSPIAEYKVTRVKTWPLVPGTEVEPVVYTNFITNPRFHVDTTGWTGTSTLSREVSVPFGDLPVGADACACFPLGSLLSIPVPIVQAETTVYRLAFIISAVPNEGSPPDHFSADLALTLYDVSNNVVETKNYYPTNFHFSMWNTSAQTVISYASDVDHAVLSIQPYQDGITGSAYITKVCLALPFDISYGDGDQAGWSWDGTEHASISSGTA